jgi:ligand-binding sensor domain-containing protein
MNKIFIYLLTSFMFVGCASITGSKNQPLSVTTTHDKKPITGVNCELNNDKGKWFVTTPGSVIILKSYEDLTVVCKKEDTKHAGVNTFKSTNEGAVWGNVLTGGLIGYAVDASTGAGFSYEPILNVEMNKE